AESGALPVVPVDLRLLRGRVDPRRAKLLPRHSTDLRAGHHADLGEPAGRKIGSLARGRGDPWTGRAARDGVPTKQSPLGRRARDRRGGPGPTGRGRRRSRATPPGRHPASAPRLPGRRDRGACIPPPAPWPTPPT